MLLAPLTLGLLASGCAAEADVDLPIMEEPLVEPLAAPNGGYLVRPDAEGHRPLVILSHGRRDLAEDLQELADGLAGRGYAVFLRPPQRTSSRPDDLGDLTDALARLREAPWVDPLRVGLVGFCGGGYQSLLLASRADHDLAAVVSFYGPLDLPDRFQPDHGPRFRNLFDVVGQIRAPVQGHYGDADEIIPAADADRLAQVLDESGREGDVFVYEGAEHGFCDHTHGHYDGSSCRLATARLLEFLDVHLAEAPS